MNPFSKVPVSRDHVFQVMAQTSLGKLHLRQADSLSVPLTFGTYPLGIQNQLKAITQKGFPLAASFVTDGSQGWIYHDSQAELGVLIALLFHELVHSTDERLWSWARNPGTLLRKREVLFQSECLAYQTQSHFLEEMKSKFPQFREFLERSYAHVPFFHRQLTPGEISNLYFPSAILP